MLAAAAVAAVRESVMAGHGLVALVVEGSFGFEAFRPRTWQSAQERGDKLHAEGEGVR